MEEETSVYQVQKFDSTVINTILDEVFESLEERGYDSISQLVGYLMSGDSGYISSYKGARNKITSVNRGKILEFLVERYFEDKKWNI